MAHPQMAIDIAEFTDLEAVAIDAHGALDRRNQASLFDRLDWYRLLLLQCPFAGTPLIVRARDEEGTVWLFMSRQGRRATALANWYSFETGTIDDGVVRPALVEALARHLRRRFTVVELAPIGSDRLATMIGPFRAAGWIVQTAETTVSWAVTIADADWNNYLKMRPSRLQSTLKRKQKSSQLSIRISNTFSEDEWRSYESVYESSWKSAEGSPDFLRTLARQEGEAGTLRLGLAFDEGTPVAAQFWLVENGTAMIHKLAHLEARRSASPGTILTAAMFRHAIEQDQVRRIDFGTGDDAYKADWMDRREALFRLTLFNPASIQGLLGAARESLSGARARIRRTP